MLDHRGSQAPHQACSKILDQLHNILLGYSLPEPFFKPRVTSLLEALVEVGADPSVPFLEMRGAYQCEFGCFFRPLRLIIVVLEWVFL